MTLKLYCLKLLSVMSTLSNNKSNILAMDHFQEQMVTSCDELRVSALRFSQWIFF